MIQNVMPRLISLWLVALMAGCVPAKRGWNPAAGDATASGGAGHGKASDAAGRGGPQRVLAYVAGRPITTQALLPGMLEAVGGVSLNEAVLEVMLDRRLESAGVEVTPPMLDAERQLLQQTLADDEDDAARLLAELRRRRGLGEVRFKALLRRNAGLRALVADRVTVTETATQREYELQHGPAARVRLLLSDTLREAQRLREQAAAAETAAGFGELAALHSIDESAAQGGLLPWIRRQDSSFPEALRRATAELEPGELSPIITLDGGFALLRLEERRPGDGTEFAAVRDDLEQAVRRRAERLLMQQLARELTSAAEVVVLDPALKDQWERQREGLE